MVSIIVPAYNAEKTLNKCLDSILSQTFHNWELLLIDDGSTDSSGEICDEYAAKDKRVKVFHKENGGVSSARNLGLDNAKGKWITFVDSDDELLQKSFDIIEKTSDCDLILGTYCNHLNNKCRLYKLKIGIYTLNNGLLNFYAQNLRHVIFNVVWGKFFKRDLIKNLRFDIRMRIGEDTLFMMKYLNRIKKCAFIDNVLYKYNIPMEFTNKYKQSINDSIYCLSNIFFAYKKLNIKSKEFEVGVFTDYKLFCQDYIYREPMLWYNNILIKNIYKEIKSSLPIKYKISYTLMSYRIINKVAVFIRKFVKYQ